MMNMVKDRRFILISLLFALVSLAYGFLVIKDFLHPLVGSGDTSQWSYIGYYFTKNLSFNPFPHLNLVSDQVFYPYGTSHVFQSWMIEANIIYSVLFSWFGSGPWLQLITFFSVVLSAVGVTALLTVDY